MFFKGTRAYKALKESGILKCHRIYGSIEVSEVIPVDKKITSIEEKLDLIIDHLDLEYEPVKECGPTLKPKQQESDAS